MTDADYLRMAYAVAIKSKDPSTQNGAVLVDPASGTVVASGWNDVHPPFADTPDRRQRPLKYEWTEHAERAAVFAAARAGVKTDGLTMYVPWAACADCGRAIVLAGVRRVVCHCIPEHDERSDWVASIAAAGRMFHEAGVEVVRVRERLCVTLRFGGREVSV